MNSKFKPISQVTRIPNTDKWAVIRQYSENGPLFTDSNNGAGYDSEEEALKAANSKAPGEPA